MCYESRKQTNKLLGIGLDSYHKPVFEWPSIEGMFDWGLNFILGYKMTYLSSSS